MKATRTLTLAISCLIMLLMSSAYARVTFELTEFSLSDADTQKQNNNILELCSNNAASFWCAHTEDTLTLVPTKGVDFIFTEAGELAAAFGKQQKGQDLKGRYSLDNRLNLISYRSDVPAGAILIDGEYFEPQNISSEWRRLNDTEFLGVFSYQAGDYQVDKEIVLSNVQLTLNVDVEVTRLVEGEDEAVVQYVVPGIGKTDALEGDSSPVVKLGQGESFTLNPLSQPIQNPTYASLQNNNRNTANALVLCPRGADGECGLDADIAAQFVAPNKITLQKTLEADEGASVIMSLRQYSGNNELVRYYQEGYLGLEGLFRPNILGRLSFGVLWILLTIHGFVGSWGLSIILLTLVFRIIVWPLITTQTKSMYGMQQIQPKVQALQKKYKDDKEKLTQETMKLYKEAGVNPAGGCLPILLQMPLFIILWRVFANFEFNEGFLWVPDLGQADPYFILPVLYVGVMVAQSWFSAKGNPQALRQQLMMNVVFVFFIISFPAGVTLYWVASMLVQVFQYWLIQRNQPAPVKAT